MCWQLACELKVALYRFVESPQIRRDFRFYSQVRDAAASAPRNIAEEFSRRTHADFAHFLDMARASLGECQNHLHDAVAVSVCTGRSGRELPRQLAPLEYPGHFEVRLVSRNSRIRWKKRWVCVTHTLAGEYVGLVEVGDGLWDVYFGPLKLGRMDERIRRIEDHKGRTVRKQVLPMSPD